MSIEHVIRTLQHIALTIEQATGLEPSSIAGLTGIWGHVSENPESLGDPAVLDAFVTAMYQVLPDFSLSQDLQWQALARGARMQTQISAQRFAGVDNQALVPLRDWLMEQLGADHALFASQEWHNVVHGESKLQPLLELRHGLILAANVDLLECPYLPDPWRLFLQKKVNAELEQDLRTQHRATELRAQPRGELAGYGQVLLEAHQQPAQNVFFARRLNAARTAAHAYMSGVFGPVPLEFMDVLAKTSWYLDQLSRGNYAEAAQILDLMGAEQLRFGTLMILQEDLVPQRLGEVELLVPFEFDYVGAADRALRSSHLSPEEWEATRESLRADGLSEFEILSWESLVELSDVRARLQAFAWAMEHFHENASHALISDIVRVHKLGISFSEREADLQAAAQEKWQAMGGVANPSVDWVSVFFYVHYQRMLGIDVAKAAKFQHEAEKIYPDKGLARYTSLNQATQNFLDEHLGNGWREWFPVASVADFSLASNSVLARFGEALVNAEAAQNTMSSAFTQRFRAQIHGDPQFSMLQHLPENVLGLVAQGEYYFYLIANHRIDEALAVHEQIGDAVIYFAASLRFQTFPVEVTLGESVRVLIPQTSNGTVLVQLSPSADVPVSMPLPLRVEPSVQLSPELQIGDFFYNGLLRTALFGEMVGELLQSPQLDTEGQSYVREYEHGQIEHFLHNAHEVNAALQVHGKSLAQAVDVYVASKSEIYRRFLDSALPHLPPQVRALFQADVAQPQADEDAPVETQQQASSGGHTFAPQVDPRMQELIAKLGRGTSSELLAEDFFPATVTTSEPLPENLLQLKLPGFTAPEVSSALPPRETINPEDLPSLTLERGSIVALKVPKLLPEVDGYAFADYPAQPFTAAQLADTMNRKNISDQTFVMVHVEGRPVQMWDLKQLQEFLTDYEKNQAMSERGFAEATLPLPPVLFPIGAPAALSGLFFEFKAGEAIFALPALAH